MSDWLMFAQKVVIRRGICVAECCLWHAGFSPAGRHAKVPPRQVSGQLTNLHRARTCQGSLRDPDEVSCCPPKGKLILNLRIMNTLVFVIARADIPVCLCNLASHHSGTCIYPGAAVVLPPPADGTIS